MCFIIPSIQIHEILYIVYFRVNVWNLVQCIVMIVLTCKINSKFHIISIRISMHEQLKSKPSANCACAILLIDGLGWAGLFESWSPASSSRRVWHGLATVVDSMRESIHAIRCDFLSPQGTQSERIWAQCDYTFRGISLERSRFRKIARLFFRLA